MKDIITERLVLRPMCLDYLHSAHEYASDPENTTYMIFLPSDSIEATEEYIREAEKEFEKESPSYYEMAVLLNGVHIGAVSLYLDDSRSSGELGWTINKRWWRNGFAFEAASALMDYAVKELGVRHFSAHCDTENIPSRRVMEKLGMRLESEHGGRKNKQSDEERREYLFVYDVPDRSDNGKQVDR